MVHDLGLNDLESIKIQDLHFRILGVWFAPCCTSSASVPLMFTSQKIVMNAQMVPTCTFHIGVRPFGGVRERESDQLPCPSGGHTLVSI